MSDPIVSFPGDGVVPAGSPKLTFLENPTRAFTTSEFSFDANLGATDSSDDLGNFGGSQFALGKGVGSASVDLRSISEYCCVPGFTFVHQFLGKGWPMIVTQVGRPQSKEGEIKISISFQEIANPLILVPIGNYTFTQGVAIDPISFSVASRHTVEASAFSIETEKIEHFRPLQIDRAAVDCDIVLPDGLTLSAGQITGTPTTVEEKNIRVRAYDAVLDKEGWRDIQFAVEAA